MNALQTSLENICRTIWQIPNNNKIIFPSNQSYNLDTLDKPFVIIDIKSRDTSKHLSFGDSSSIYRVHLWLFIPTNNSVNCLSVLKQDLINMMIEIFTNNKLNDVVSFTDNIECNWLGAEDKLNFMTLPALGIRYGYVSFNTLISHGGF